MSSRWVLLWAALSAVASAQSGASFCAVDSALPPPTNTACGARGQLSAPSVLSTIQSDGLQSDCARVCLQTTGCESFSFVPASFMCTLYRSAISGQGLSTNTNSNSYFWEKACFAVRTNCSAVASMSSASPSMPSSSALSPSASPSSARPTSTPVSSSRTASASVEPTVPVLQVLRDGSFENFTTYHNWASNIERGAWVMRNGSSMDNYAAAKEGRYYLQISIKPDGSVISPFPRAFTYQDVNTIVGRRYNISFYAMTPQNCYGCRLSATQNGMEMAYAAWGATAVPNTWQLAQGSFIATTRITRIAFSAMLSSTESGSIRVDDVSLTTAYDATEASCRVRKLNHISDSSFENSTSSAWFLTGSSRASSTGNAQLRAKTGTTSVSIPITWDPVYRMQGKAVGNFYQDLPTVRAGVPLALRFWVHVPNVMYRGSMRCGVSVWGNITSLASVDRSAQSSPTGPTAMMTGTGSDYVLGEVEFTPRYDWLRLSVKATCDGTIQQSPPIVMSVDEVTLVESRVQCGNEPLGWAGELW